MQPLTRFITSYLPYVLKHSTSHVQSSVEIPSPSLAIVDEPVRCRTDDPERYKQYKYFINDAISPEMQQTILRDYRRVHCVQYTCKSPFSSDAFQIEMHYYLPLTLKSLKSSRMMKTIELYVKSLFVMFFNLESIQSPYIRDVVLSKNGPIRIYFAPTEFKKHIPREVCHRKPFVFENDMVNSGYTTHGMNGRYIVIYRREEFSRLLFHECIHYIGLDGASDSWIDFQQFRDDTLLNVEGELRIFEAYTDTYAIYWNILIRQYLMRTKTSTVPVPAIPTLWKREINHQRKLIEHCMYCIGANSIDQWLPGAPADNRITWTMNTATFAYYILKHGAFLRGTMKFQEMFPFGATLWSRDKIKQWYEFCIDGMKTVSDKYHARCRAKDAPTTMSAICSS